MPFLLCSTQKPMDVSKLKTISENVIIKLMEMKGDENVNKIFPHDQFRKS